MIRFVCDGCHKKLEIGNEYGGGLGNCPFCGTDTRLPFKRTSKIVILLRLFTLPALVGYFWTLVLGLSCWITTAMLFAIFLYLWGGTNLLTFLWCPREYLIWRKGGGDPWFDTLPPGLNNDPQEVRWQELYREKDRQECVQVNRQLGLPDDFMMTPAPPSDPPKGTS